MKVLYAIRDILSTLGHVTLDLIKISFYYFNVIKKKHYIQHSLKIKKTRYTFFKTIILSNVQYLYIFLLNHLSHWQK